MKGITAHTKDQINSAVETLFDKVAFYLLGDIPQLKNKKNIYFSTKPNFSLANLFVSSLAHTPNPNETEALKNLLSTAHNYIEALKHKTKANLSEQVDSYIMNQRSKGATPSQQEIKQIVFDNLKKAGGHIKTIGEAEATKARNMGKVLNIARVGASQGETDPYCYFVVVRDNVTCPSCIRLHLMPDKITPRVWKLSEVSFAYGKKNDTFPTLTRHPNCRCSLTYLSQNWGFKGGKVSYIAEGHDELKKQRGEE
jgi:hypothetical protein